MCATDDILLQLLFGFHPRRTHRRSSGQPCSRDVTDSSFIRLIAHQWCISIIIGRSNPFRGFTVPYLVSDSSNVPGRLWAGHGNQTTFHPSANYGTWLTMYLSSGLQCITSLVCDSFTWVQTGLSASPLPQTWSELLSRETKQFCTFGLRT